MIEPNIYCKVSGMVMQCVADSYKETKKLPVVVEIGTAEGNGTRRYGGFCELVVAVDPMQDGRPDLFEKEYSDMKPNTAILSAFESNTKGLPVRLVVGCSLWKRTVESVRKELGAYQVDVLVIDGCHHPFEAVWADFTTYQDLVRPGGYVIFDDLYEECILQAYQKAQAEFGYAEHERWSKKNGILQDVGALRKS